MEFSPADSLGALPVEHVARYLRDIGDEESAKALTLQSVQGQSFLGINAPYGHNGTKVGFIYPGGAGTDIEIVAANDIIADATLIDTQIKISFDAAYIHDYPGIGLHKVLCEFVGKNQLEGEVEALRMALRYSANDRGFASAQGVPIFLGLTVGPNGISFEGRSINVRSTTDDLMLEAMESSAFRSGLALVRSVQPALTPFVKLVQSAVNGVLKRSQNKQIHTYNLGLDFSDTTTSARLRLGSYIIVQTDAVQWDWSSLVWDSSSAALRFRDSSRVIDFNYSVVSVSKYTAGEVAVRAKKSRAKATA